MTCSMLWHLGLIYHKAHWCMWLKRAHPWYASLAPAMDRLSGEKLYQTRLRKIYCRYLQWRIHHIPPIGYQFIALCASQPQLATVTCPEKCVGRLQTPSHHSIDLLEVILSVPIFYGQMHITWFGFKSCHMHASWYHVPRMGHFFWSSIRDPVAVLWDVFHHPLQPSTKQSSIKALAEATGKLLQPWLERCAGIHRM